MTPTLKILHLISQRPEATGSGIYVRAMVEHAQRAGHRNYLLAGIAPDDVPDLNGHASDQCAFVRFGGEDLPFPVAGMSDVMPYESICFKDLDGAQIETYEQCFKNRLQDVVEHFMPDLIHSHHLWLLTSVAKRTFPEIPVATTCHGTDLRQFQNCPHLRARVLEGCRRLEAVMALSASQKDDIVSMYGINSARIHVAGVGYNERLFSFGAEKAKGPAHLIYAGKLCRAKGVPWMLRALSTIAHLPWNLELVGGGTGPEKEECLHLAKRLGKRVTIHGAVSQDTLAQILKISHLFILPSFFEGLPIVLLEAMACGCRVVTTALPGLNSLFTADPGKLLKTVAMPRLENVDRPLAEEEMSFEARLADSISEQIRDIEKSSSIDSSLLSAILGPHTWSSVFKRVETVYRQIAS